MLAKYETNFSFRRITRGGRGRKFTTAQKIFCPNNQRLKVSTACHSISFEQMPIDMVLFQLQLGALKNKFRIKSISLNDFCKREFTSSIGSTMSDIIAVKNYAQAVIKVFCSCPLSFDFFTSFQMFFPGL